MKNANLLFPLKKAFSLYVAVKLTSFGVHKATSYVPFRIQNSFDSRYAHVCKSWLAWAD